MNIQNKRFIDKLFNSNCTKQVKTVADSRVSKISGFTIVELLVVIVIIGILATISIVSYVGISKQATIATITSDLDNAYKKFKLYQIEKSGYPTGIELNCTTPITATNICLKPSPNNQYTLTTDNTVANSQSFCLVVKNTTINTRYYVTNDSVPAPGGCPIAAPANFVATTVNTTSINLTWSAVSGVASYTLQRSTDPSFVSPAPTTIPTTTASVSASLTGLTAGTLYYFRIMASTAEDNSLWASAQAKTYYSTTFAYTGAQQTWTVPAGITSAQIEAWGAQGGSDNSNIGYGINSGGKGGYAKGVINVTTGQSIYVYVGGKGQDDYCTTSNGGYNGGGNGTPCLGGGGGGASDVRIGGTALSARFIIAGGGGGSTYHSTEESAYPGGDGGGLSGSTGIYGGAVGGTQSTGNALGIGQSGGGGGGGGYYGGYSSDTSGGGGSGYIGGVSNGTMSNGVNSGNGYITITYY